MYQRATIWTMDRQAAESQVVIRWSQREIFAAVHTRIMILRLEINFRRMLVSFMIRG